MSSIQVFTDNLYENKIDMAISDYIKEIQIRFQPKLSIKFMNFFLDICRRLNEHCITQEILSEYNLCNNHLSHVKDFVKSKELEKDIDYIIKDVR